MPGLFKNFMDLSMRKKGDFMTFRGQAIFCFFLLFGVSAKLPADSDRDTRSFALHSPAFQNRGEIPKIHACERFGGNLSPKLQWTNPPPQTKSFALTCHDPDAPGGQFIHWIVYHLPVQVRQLDEGLERKQQLPDGTFQGINSFQRLGYDGPCPPKGPPHHYIFTLYALDRSIDIQGTATFESLQEAMKGHILGKAQLIGIFQSKE